MKEILEKLRPYFIVFIGFCAASLIFLFVIDWLVLPGLVREKASIKMPDVVGKTLPEAEKILESAGLQSRKISEQNNDAFPQGVVAIQSPAKDLLVKSDRTVYLTVSKGENAMDVPNLVGLPSRQARVLAMNRGFTIGDIDYKNSDLFGSDTVVNQTKRTGSKLSPGSPIGITISTGPEMQVAVPNLVNKNLEEIKSLLTESKLQLGEITSIKNETYVPNTVIGQNPEGGALVKQNTRVNVTITK